MGEQAVGGAGLLAVFVFYGLFCCLYNLIHEQQSAKPTQAGALLLKSKITEKKCFDCEGYHLIYLFSPKITVEINK